MNISATLYLVDSALYIGLCWLLTTSNKNQPTISRSLSFCKLLRFVKRFICFWGKTKFSPSHNHTHFYGFGNLSGFLKWRNSNSRSDKTKTIFYKVSFNVHWLVGLIYNSTISKQQIPWLSLCLQKRESKLVLSLPAKDCLFLPHEYLA